MARVFSTMLCQASRMIPTKTSSFHKFSTGGGEKCSNHVLLESCPLVRSFGLDVERVDLV